MPAVQVQDLHKRFDNGAVALAGVSLDVEPGELLVLLGPSGCGKSTVLRCIAGLEQPTSGRVLIDGADVTAVPPQSRDVAMVFQSYALYPHMTVAENIGFPLRMRGRPKDEIARRVDEAADLLGLRPLAARRPAQLSGGERQRVALGRAIVREPKAFLFDEPLSNLDARLRAAMRAELLALHARLGRATLFVTHDQVEAMTMGRRIAVMRQGLVQQTGTPKEIYQRPANEFVAQFVGSPGMNVLAAPPRRRAEASRVGFRPEDAVLVAPEDGEWHGPVRLVEPLGAETLVHLVVEDDEPVVVRLRGGDAPRLGSVLGIHVENDRIHRFGPDGSRFA